MKLFILVLLFSGTAWSAKIYNEGIKDFEEEMHIKFAGDLEKHAADNLEKVEKEVNENNEKFENGESLFEEKLYPESVLDKEEFEKEKEGLVLNADRTVGLRKMPRATGLILAPEAERNGPLNYAKLAKLDAELALNRQSTPESYNAVDAGLVTTAKNQQQCGSCAAFAATGMHESAMLKAGATFKGLDLSEQQILDCGFNGQGMNGCNGAGLDDYTAWFIKKGGEGAHENTYAYKAKKQTCPASLTTYSTTKKVSKYISASNHGEARLKEVISQYGAAIVGVYATDDSFGNYASGIYTGCTSKQANHAVLAVGYGADASGNKYWLVKNSWGTNWGESGYFKVQRGTDMCGIESAGVVAASAAAADGEQSTVPDSGTASTTTAPATGGSCDVSDLFGTSSITGSYELRVRIGWGWNDVLISHCDCVNSVCSPQSWVTGVTNVCEYICGSDTC